MSKAYRMGEFAKRIGRSAQTVRRWEREGKLVAKRLPSGHRAFDESDGRHMMGGAPEKRLRTIAYQPAHTIVDKAAVVVAEDLTAPIVKKQAQKRYNRRMGAWAKGVLAEADSVCTQRPADHRLVNAAYTSQMDSVSGLLEGKRVVVKFYRVNGDVLQAEHNAALNVLARYEDTEITRFTPYREVRRILLARSPAQPSVNRHELQVMSTYQPCADRSSVQICTGL